MSLARDLALALDPARLLERAGIMPDEWQRAVLRSSARRVLLNGARQSGKSTISAGLGVHSALYEAGALVLLLSPSLRQSSELFKKCLAVYRALGRPVPADSETALTLTLENGSRIASLPGTEGTVRGFSGVTLLLVDEASRVPDDLYYAIRPMLAVSGGRLVALSTPWGKRGWWYDAWAQGGAAWERVRVPAEQCPRITPAFLAEERATLPDLVYRSEYGCEFTDTVDQVFRTEDVLGAISAEVAPLFGGAA